MSSYAAEETKRLLKLIDVAPLSSQLSSDDSENEEEQHRQALNSLRTRTRYGPLLPAEIVQLLDESLPSSNQSIGFESLYWTNIVIEACGSVLQDLLRTAAKLQNDIQYWRDIEEQDLERAYYLLQTAPLRAANLIRMFANRARAIPAPTSGNFTLARFRELLPPSLLVTTLFPHLAAGAPAFDETASTISEPRRRRLTTWTLSPLTLAAQEARRQRRALQKQLGSVLSRLGSVARGLQNCEQVLRQDSASPQLVVTALARDTKQNSLRNGSDSSPQVFARNLIDRHQTLVREADTTIKQHGQPSRWTRIWPRAIFIPFGMLLLSRRIYVSRQALYELVESAQQTTRSFIIDWVEQPVLKIFNTIRHGDSTLALMGKQSLSSDLDSLERMVVDFDREVYQYSGAQLADAGKRVREGDLTEVLRAWERDIKTPVKSAAFGTLIRTLLIQIQKVKVDVDLAMDGIEKMLQSQQLTFAFIGVAPSIIILVGAVRYIRGLFNVNPQGSSRAKAEKRQAWLALRTVDKLFHEQDAGEHDDHLLGSTLLHLQVLRDFAASRGFPIKNKAIRKDFIGDVRDLEITTTDALRRRKIDRFWRTWSFPLAFTSM